MAEGSYVRLFYEDLMRAHPDVWNDPMAFFVFTHLLAHADKLWPTPAELPRKVDEAGLEVCKKSGVISVNDLFVYQVKGLDKMRQARQRQTQPARLALADKTASEPATASATGSVTDSGDPHARARGRSGLVWSESSSSPNEESGTLRAREAELTVLDWMRANGVQRIVGRVLLDLEELVADHGAQKVIAAMESLGPQVEAAQYVYGARNTLRPIPSGRRVSPADQRKAEIDDAVARARKGELSARH